MINESYDLLKRRLAREQKAREAAEILLEEKSLALFESNVKLKDANIQLTNVLADKNNILLRRELEYKSLVENIKDIICKTDLSGIITYVNPIIKSILGFDEEEIVEKLIFDFLPNSIKNKSLQFFQNQIKSSSCALYIEVPINSKFKEIIWFGVNIQFYSDCCSSCEKLKCVLKTNQVIKTNNCDDFKEVIIVARNITEQKIIQKILVKQTRSLEQGIIKQELTSEIALELNSIDSFKKRVNKVLAKVGKHTGSGKVYIFEDFDNRKFTKNTFEWCRPGIVPEIKNLQKISYTLYPSWNSIIAKEGRIFAEDIAKLPDDLQPILQKLLVKSIVVYPLTIRDKQIGFIGFIESQGVRKWSKTDIELLRSISGIVSASFEREYMERSIKQERDSANKANSAKSEFLANMSHEIRTPMNAILGFSEVLSLAVEKPKHREMLKSIVKSGKLLLSILNDILDFSKLDAGKTELVYSATKIRKLVVEIIHLFSVNAAKKGIYLNYSIESNVPDLIELDEYRIKQVCFNLIGNAIKFTDSGGVNVLVSFQKSNPNKGKLLINVHDTGIGIDPSQVKVIFGSFKQQYGQADRKYGGTGLGLAISLKLIENMGGSINVNSDVGKGSDFAVVIPNIKISSRTLDTKSEKDSSQGSTQPYYRATKVLIVDRVEDNVQILSELLLNIGIEVDVALNGENALVKCKNINYNLIFMDTRLLDCDSYVLSQQVRKFQPQSKIIAYTTSINRVHKFSCVHTFDGYLVKPIDNEKLKQLLSEYLSPPKFNEKIPLRASKVKLTEQQLTDISIVTDHLTRYFIPKWERIKDYLILYDIEEFAMELMEYSTQKSISSFVDYSNKLKEFLDLIDLENIKVQLLKFPILIENLKQYN